MTPNKKELSSIKKWFGSIKFEIQILTDYHKGDKTESDESGVFLCIHSITFTNFFGGESVRAWFELENGKHITAFAEKK